MFAAVSTFEGVAEMDPPSAGNIHINVGASWTGTRGPNCRLPYREKAPLFSLSSLAMGAPNDP